MKITKKLLTLLAALVALGFVSTGCKEKTPEEKVVDAVKDAAEKTGDAAKDAAKKVEDAVKK